MSTIAKIEKWGQKTPEKIVFSSKGEIHDWISSQKFPDDLGAPPPTIRAVLHTLVTHVNIKSNRLTVWPNQVALAETVQTSERSVRRALKAAEKFGIIKTETVPVGGNGHLSNNYTFTPTGQIGRCHRSDWPHNKEIEQGKKTKKRSSGESVPDSETIPESTGVEGKLVNLKEVKRKDQSEKRRELYVTEEFRDKLKPLIDPKTGKAFFDQDGPQGNKARAFLYALKREYWPESFKGKRHTKSESRNLFNLFRIHAANPVEACYLLEFCYTHWGLLMINLPHDPKVSRRQKPSPALIHQCHKYFVGRLYYCTGINLQGARVGKGPIKKPLMVMNG